MPVSIIHKVRTTFGASHVLDGHPVCGRMHGHSYTVELTFYGYPKPDSWGSPVLLKDAQAAMTIVDEFRDRHLNDMLPAGHPSVDGLAAYLLERTRIHGVTKVEVYESDTRTTGTAEFIDR
jgi:6-pyruvoyl-tetrahydropterin synthase